MEDGTKTYERAAEILDRYIYYSKNAGTPMCVSVDVFNYASPNGGGSFTMENLLKKHFKDLVVHTNKLGYKINIVDKNLYIYHAKVEEL